MVLVLLLYCLEWEQTFYAFIATIHRPKKSMNYNKNQKHIWYLLFYSRIPFFLVVVGVFLFALSREMTWLQTHMLRLHTHTYSWICRNVPFFPSKTVCACFSSSCFSLSKWKKHTLKFFANHMLAHNRTVRSIAAFVCSCACVRIMRIMRIYDKMKC